MNDTKQLVCPDCGESRFSWIIEQVQFGDAYEFESGHRDVEGFRSGEVVGSDISENGLYCTGCDDFVEMDDLVPEAEVDA